MLLDGKACHPATFAHTNLLTILRYLNCCQTLYSITTDLGLVFPALFISGTHKVAGLNLTVGRSRDQVLQRAKNTFVPSSSTSSIISRSSSSVGFCPSDLMTVPSSDDEIDPPPSLSNKMNASLSSEMKYAKSKTQVRSTMWARDITKSSMSDLELTRFPGSCRSKHREVPSFWKLQIWGAFFWAYSGIGIVGISQTIVRSRATLIPEWL